MKNHYLLCIYFLFFYQTVFSQQLPLFTQYRDHHSFINPASINSDYFTQQYNLAFGASYRMQWASQPFTPRTQALRMDYLFVENENVGLLTGVNIIHDKVGPSETTGIYGRLAGIIGRYPDEAGIAVGLSAGVKQFRIDFKEIRTRDSQLDGCDCQKIIPDVGLGIYAYKIFDNQDVLYGGGSIPQFVEFERTLSFTDTSTTNIKLVQHYFGNVGFYKTIGSNLLEASIWAKYVKSAPFNLDVNLRFIPYVSKLESNVIWVGVGYSTSQTVHAEFGLFLGENLGWNNLIRLGYSFSHAYNTFGPFFGNSHEINVAFLIDY